MKSMLSSSRVSFQSIFTAFYNTMAFVHIGTAFVAQGSMVLIPIPPFDEVQEVTDMVIDQYSLWYVCNNSKQGGSPTASPTKKRKTI